MTRIISIHALREEGDPCVSTRADCAALFLSTPSARRATRDSLEKYRHVFISIHALREEGDGQKRTATEFVVQFLSTPSARRATGFANGPTSTASYFYPRPPRGGRPML